MNQRHALFAAALATVCFAATGAAHAADAAGKEKCQQAGGSLNTGK